MREKGTTFIEVVIYIGLLGALFTVIVSVLLNSANTLEEVTARRAVNRSGLLVVERIGATIRSASDVDTATSTFSVAASKLGLIESGNGVSTSTVFYTDSGKLYINVEGTEDVLTGKNINVVEFEAENVSVGSTTAVKIDLVVSHPVGTTSIQKHFQGTFNARGSYDSR